MAAESKGRLTLAGAFDFARRLPHGAEKLVRGVREQVGKIATFSVAGAGLFAGLGAAHAENTDPRYLQIDPAADRFMAGQPSMGGLFDQAAPSDDGFVPASAYSTKLGGGRVDGGSDRVTLRPPAHLKTAPVVSTSAPKAQPKAANAVLKYEPIAFGVSEMMPPEAADNPVGRDIAKVFEDSARALDQLALAAKGQPLSHDAISAWRENTLTALRSARVPNKTVVDFGLQLRTIASQAGGDAQLLADHVLQESINASGMMIAAAVAAQATLSSDDPRGLFGGEGGQAALIVRNGQPIGSGQRFKDGSHRANGRGPTSDMSPDTVHAMLTTVPATEGIPSTGCKGITYVAKSGKVTKCDIKVTANGLTALDPKTGKPLFTLSPNGARTIMLQMGGDRRPLALVHSQAPAAAVAQAVPFVAKGAPQEGIQIAALSDEHRSILTDANNDIGHLPYLTYTDTGRPVTMTARAEGGMTVTGAATFTKTLEPTSVEVAYLPPLRTVDIPQMRGDFQLANGRIDLSPADAANLDDFYKRWHEANPNRALLLKELLPFEQRMIDESLKFAPTCGVEALRNSVIERVYAERLLGRYVAGKTSGDVMGVHDLIQTRVGDKLVDIVPKAWNRKKDVHTYTDKGGYFEVAGVIVMQPSKETGGRWHVWVEREGMRDVTAISEIDGSGRTTFLNYDVRSSEGGAVRYEGDRGRRPYRADFKLAGLAACAAPAAAAPKVAPPPTPAPAPVVHVEATPAPACRLTEHPLAVSADVFTTRIREIPELAALPQAQIDAVRALLASHDADLARAEMDAVRGYLLAEYATPSSAFELKNNLDNIFTWIHGNQSTLASTNRLHRDLQMALADPRFKLEKPSQIEIVFAADRTESLRRLGAFYHVHEYIREHESPAAAEQFVLNFLQGTLDWKQIATVTGALVIEEQAKIATLPSIASVNQPAEGTVPANGALAPRYFDWLRAAATDYQLALRGSDNAGHNGVGSINDLTNDTPQGERVRGWLRDIAEQHRVRFFDDLRNKHPDLANNPALTAHLTRAFDLATQALLAQPQLLERGDWGFMDLFFRSFTSGPINALTGGQNAPSDSQTGRYRDRRVDRPAFALAAETSLLDYQIGDGTRVVRLPGDVLSQKTNRFTVSYTKDGQRVAMGTGETRDGIIAERVLNSCDLPPSAAFIGELHSRAAGEQIVDFLLPKWEWLRDISDDEFAAAQVAGIFPRELNGQTITVEYLRRHATDESARLTRLVHVKFAGATSAVINFEQLDNPLLGLLERYGVWKLAQHGKDHWFKGDDPQPPPPPKTPPLAEVGGGGGTNVTPPPAPVAPILID